MMTSRKVKTQTIEETLVVSPIPYAEQDIQRLNQNLQRKVEVLRMRIIKVEKEHEQEKKNISLQHNNTLSSKDNEIKEKIQLLDSKDKQISINLNQIQELKTSVKDLEKMTSHLQGKLETEKRSKEQLKLNTDKRRSDLTQYESRLKDTESIIEQHKKKINKLESEMNDMFEQMKCLTIDHKQEIKAINKQHKKEMKKVMKDHEEAMKHQEEESMAAMKQQREEDMVEMRNLREESLEIIKNAVSYGHANVVQIKMQVQKNPTGEWKQSEQDTKLPPIQ